MKTNDNNGVYNTLFQWKNFRLKIVGEGVIVGIFSGLMVVLYRFLLEEAASLTKIIYTVLNDRLWLLPVWFTILIAAGVVIGLIVKLVPMASGSGIPQVEGVLLRRLHMNWWKVIAAKFAGGVLSIGTGLSLGREGPSIQIGAAVGQGISRMLKRMKVEEKYLITSGASAGLAAAFNAPLAGVMFSLEEIHKHFSPLVLLSATSSALTADFISKQFFGTKPVFNFNNISPLPLNNYGFIIILGILVGLCGTMFNKVLFKTQDLYSKQKWLPEKFRPVIPLIIAGSLCLILPQVLGGGHELIMSLVDKNYTLKMLVLLLFVKFMFTMLSYGSGAPGGIFLPLLAIGALTGSIYGNVLVNVFGIDNGYVNNFIILAMAGCFTAIVKSPITGSILITEMTGSFEHLLSVTIICIISYVTADLLRSKPVYEELLNRLLKKSNPKKYSGDESVSTILEIAVNLKSTIEGKRVKDLKWPEESLLVGIKRGEHEIIPHGKTRILSGDFLIILTNEKVAGNVKKSLLEMASEYSE